MELDDILNERPEQPKEPAPAAPSQESLPLEPAAPQEPAVETVKSTRKAHQAKEQEAQDAGRKRNPDGTFAPAEPKEDPAAVAAPAAPETPPAAPAQPRQELTAKEKAFLADAQAERAKRQELERRLAALEQQRAQPVQQGQPPAEGQPATFWDNPTENLTKYQQSIKQELVQTKIQISEEFAKARHPDYEEKIPVFGEMLRTTPGLYEQWIAAPNMAEFAYSLASNKMALQEAGDLPNYRKKIEEETRAAVRKEIEEENAKKEAERQKLAAALPRTLSDVRGVNQQTPVFTGPTPLDAVIAR